MCSVIPLVMGKSFAELMLNYLTMSSLTVKVKNKLHHVYYSVDAFLVYSTLPGAQDKLHGTDKITGQSTVER